jgi:hypothetical protein
MAPPGAAASGGITLQYLPSSQDFTPFVPKGRGYAQRPTAFTAIGGAGVLVHGNSVIAVNEGGEDVSATCRTWRQWRIWALKSDAAPDLAVLKLDNGWEDDNRSKLPSWMDIPGYIFVGAASGWTGQNFALEFAVRLEDKPAVPGLYFFVVVSKGAGTCRVQMSDAAPLPPAGWTTLRASREPWAAKSGCKVVVDSGPIVLPPG